MMKTEPAVTGTAVLRAAVAASKIRTEILARGAGVSNGELHAFADGKADLSPQAKIALAEFLFQHTTFDVGRDRLKPTNTEPPTPLGTRPAACTPKPIATNCDGVRGPQPTGKKSAAPSRAPATWRPPGWA